MPISNTKYTYARRNVDEKVRLKEICKDFPGVRALDHANLWLRRGEIHALVGQNGAGKSTLIKILAGLYHKDAGQIYVNGAETNIRSPKDARSLGFGFIHQELAIVPALSITENMLMGSSIPTHRFGVISWKQAQDIVMCLCDRLQLQRDLDTPIEELKTAEKWLVAIGRSLVHEVELLVLDEPTVALDNTETANLFRILRELREDGKTILYISHRLREIFEIADRVTVMKDSKTVACEQVEDVDEARIIGLMLGGQLPQPVSSSEKRRAPTKDPILSVRNLRKDGIVHSVSFDLYPGELLGLAGLVGSGRTETLELIFGVTQKDAGEIRLNGRLVSIEDPNDAVRLGLAMLPENRREQALLLKMPITQNISLSSLDTVHVSERLPLLSLRKELKLARSFIKELTIAATGPRQLAEFLSGGNQQKVVLARWLATEARVFFFDEPTVGIDVGAKQEVYNLMRRLTEQGAGLICVSSDFTELELVCDRVLVMREGALVGELSGDAITEDNMLVCCYGSQMGDEKHAL